MATMKKELNKKILYNLKFIKREYSLYLMLAPVIIYLGIFVYYTVIYGVAMSFENFITVNRHKFIGLKNYQFLFLDMNFWRYLWNTLVMSFFGVLLGVICPIAFAIMLNEIMNRTLRKCIQVITYIPSLVSWVLMGAIISFFLSPAVGPVNTLLVSLGIVKEPIFFLGNQGIAKLVFILLGQWKGIGASAILFLASIVSINPSLYESSYIDGATRFQRIRYITIPGIQNTIRIVLLLGIMGALSGFDQVYILKNPVTEPAINNVMVYTFTKGIEGGFGKSSAMTVVVMLMSLVLFFIGKKITKIGVEELVN